MWCRNHLFVEDAVSRLGGFMTIVRASNGTRFDLLENEMIERTTDRRHWFLPRLDLYNVLKDKPLLVAVGLLERVDEEDNVVPDPYRKFEFCFGSGMTQR